MSNQSVSDRTSLREQAKKLLENVYGKVHDLPLRESYGVEDVIVTQEIASRWLAFNSNNRQVIDHPRIEQYKNDMEAGVWHQNGEALKFSCGRLLDGQHRLYAALLSTVPVKMTVFHGLDNESQPSMDTGRPRTARDVASIEGLTKWESATFGTAVHGLIAEAEGGLPSSCQKYTNREVRNFFLEHRAAVEASLRVISTLPRKPAFLPLSRALAMHYLFAREDRDMADMFFNRLYIGDGLAKSSPIFQLRTRLMNDLVNKNRRSAFLECFFLVKVWNACRRGTSWKTPNGIYPKDGENFPEII